jgi:hypothetical protein
MTMDIVHFLEDEAEAFRRFGPRAGRAANRPRALGPCARKPTPRPVAPGADGGSGGVGDPSTPLEAYRGTTLCLRARSIGVGARLTVREGFDGKPRFATYRPAPDGRQSCGGQPPTRSNAGEAPAHEGALPKTPRSGRPQARPVL